MRIDSRTSGILSAVMLSAAVLSSCSRGNRGQDTTCGDFHKMSPEQQQATIDKGWSTEPPPVKKYVLRTLRSACAPGGGGQDNDRIGDDLN